MKRLGIYKILIEKDIEIIGTGSLSNLGQIRDVFVNVSIHRKGYGTKLMKMLENEAKRKKLKVYSYIPRFQQ